MFSRFIEQLYLIIIVRFFEDYFRYIQVGYMSVCSNGVMGICLSYGDSVAIQITGESHQNYG